ncbi:MAG: 3-oxo-4-pregnene-20-carboxyl-CoA dehydrogenase alpha subunit [Pseudonocardiales bacterium]|nr:3-oxo-4-pregnene-20-carboxyl-CoA dehydrogenase alpha subunit [Pseudonocardiales bacterium]MDT4943537.1 3-oxo-4-pregnene-20-carboxyl-CoA dehydrogenase alpha subunit [Pseudonocardiales bacterium]
MDFTLDETQQAVAELAATVLRSEADHARVEHVLASGPGYDETLWKAMAQAGLLALALPESLGGEGFGAVEVAALLAEVGRQTLPTPAFATLSLGVLPVVALGSAEQQATLLPEVADGRVLTAALRSATAATVRDDGAGLVVGGSFVGVPYAAQAHRILVATTAGVLLIDPDDDGVTLTRTPTSTGAPEYSVALADVRIADEDVLAGDTAVLERYALAGAAALADGIIAGGLALTAAHVGTRQQFGKALATFQAVAQQIADVYVTARTVHLASASANWRLAAGLDADDDLQIAAYWLAAELPAGLQVCHHLHGGLGVDASYPMHRFYSHAKDLARFVGGPAYRLDLIGARCSSN